MGAFDNELASYTINAYQIPEELKVTKDSPTVSSEVHIIPDNCLPQPVDGTVGRHVRITANVSGLSADKKVIFALKVNGQTKSEIDYKSNGMNCDVALSKVPPKANVRGGDIVTLELRTDSDTEVSLNNVLVWQNKGRVAPDMRNS